MLEQKKQAAKKTAVKTKEPVAAKAAATKVKLGAEKKPAAVKKTEAKKVVEVKVPTKTKAAAKKVSKKSVANTDDGADKHWDLKHQKPTPEERYRMVETAAYYIAERNGFQGDASQHWIEAEREIALKLEE